MNPKKIKTAAIAISALLAASCLAGCGVSKSDYNELERKVDQLEKQVEELGEKSSVSPTSAPGKNSSSSAKSTSAPSEKFDENRVNSEIDVEQYDFVDDNNDKYTIFVFENDSDFNVNAHIKLTAKDADDNILHEEEKTIKGLPMDGEAYVSFALDTDTETIVRTVTYEENSSKDNPLGKLSARATKADGGANITVRNSGTSEAEGLKYMTLFFEDDEVVGFDNGDVPSIASGSTAVIPSVFYGSFDEAEVYFTHE